MSSPDYRSVFSAFGASANKTTASAPSNEPTVSAPVTKTTASEPAATKSVSPGTVTPAVDEGARAECDQNSARLFNNKRFSDLTIKFHDREFHAHRLVLCQKSRYFDKLCGPESSFAEANKKEITLRDDDLDALWAMLRHLYNFLLRLPNLNSTVEEKVQFYCNVVVVADKYVLPALAEEARKSLNTFVISLEDPNTVLKSLQIITEEYADHTSLDKCAINLAALRLSELAAVVDFPGWLAMQPQFLKGIVEDAAKFRSAGKPPLQKYKTVTKYKCANANIGCTRVMVGDVKFPHPKCHGQLGIADGSFYCEDS